MQAAASDAQHAELLERINQNNILRESNATLRAECKKYSERARSLDSELKTLSAQLEPAKEEVRVVRAELQARDSQIALLSGESKHWQERNAQLLTKARKEFADAMSEILIYMDSMIASTQPKSKT